LPFVTMRRWLLLGVFCAVLVTIHTAKNAIVLEQGGDSDDTLANNIKRLASGAYVTSDDGSGDVAVAVASGESSGDDKEVTDPDDTEVSGDVSGDGETKNEVGGSGDEDGGSGDVITDAPPGLSTSKKPSTKDTTVEDINTTGATSSVEATKKAPTTPRPLVSKSPTTPHPNEIPSFELSTSQNDVPDVLVIEPDSPNAAHLNGKHHKPHPKSGKINFSIGIAIGVAVGAVLAVAIILFLVYRIRKKDSGSYILDEHSSQQSMLRNEDTKSKEYFA